MGAAREDFLQDAQHTLELHTAFAYGKGKTDTVIVTNRRVCV